MNEMTSLPLGSEHLHSIAERNPFGIFLIGSEATIAAPDCHELLEQNRLKRGKIWSTPDPDDKTWFSLATSHRRLRRGLIEAMGFGEHAVNEHDARLTTLSWCTNAKRELVKETLEKDLDGIELQEFLEQSQDCRDEMVEFANAIEGSEVPKAGRKMVSHPAMVFFLRTAIVIWLRHGVWPSTLLRRATNSSRPDFEALDWLVRADRRLGRHPLVLATKNRMSKKMRDEFERTVRFAMVRKPRKVNLSTLKLRLAGFISEVSRRMGFELEGRSIRSLFDIQARHTGKKHGILIDEDLKSGAGTLRRQIHRAREFWFPSPIDQERFESLKSVRTRLDRFLYVGGHEQARPPSS